MDTGKIKILIEAYYNGETSREEERQLFDYFNSGNVAEELLHEKELFMGMYDKEPVETPPMLEQKLEQLIDDLARKEEQKTKTASRKIWLWSGSVAAGLAILISAGVHFYKGQPLTGTDEPVQTTAHVTADDQEKIKEAQEALLLLSSKFNKGVDQLALVNANLDKTTDILNKTMNRKNDKES